MHIRNFPRLQLINPFACFSDYCEQHSDRVRAPERPTELTDGSGRPGHMDIVCEAEHNAVFDKELIEHDWPFDLVNEHYPPSTNAPGST